MLKNLWIYFTLFLTYNEIRKQNKISGKAATTVHVSSEDANLQETATGGLGIARS
jgi:hypothetical protein